MLMSRTFKDIILKQKIESFSVQGFSVIIYIKTGEEVSVRDDATSSTESVKFKITSTTIKLRAGESISIKNGKRELLSISRTLKD